MAYSCAELGELQQNMLFDIVYEGMPDHEVSAKYDISKSKLDSIKNNKVWKSEERRMWNEMIAMFLQRRNVNSMTA